MKRSILFFVLVCIGLSSMGQVGVGPKLSKDYYLEKSKNENTLAWILLIGGTAMIVVGVANAKNNSILSSSWEKSAYLSTGGLLVDLISIPVFISAGKNARKARLATNLVFDQNVFLFQYHTTFIKSAPAITLSIRL